MIQPCTFNFIARSKSRYQWDALSDIGQTVKIILDGVPHARVVASVYRWNKKVHPKFKLKLKVKAQTFMIYELVQVAIDNID